MTERVKINSLIIVIEQITDSEAGCGFGVFQNGILRCVFAEKRVSLGRGVSWAGNHVVE